MISSNTPFSLQEPILNAAAIDLRRGREYDVADALVEKRKRLECAHQKMGAIPTWTCAPWQDGLTPRFGDAIVTTESNAITYANSIIGARTNRVGDLMDICAAITGRFPVYGLYQTENRKARVRVRLDHFSGECLHASLDLDWVAVGCRHRKNCRPPA